MKKFFSRSAGACLALVATLLPASPASAGFEFKENDRIVLIGNTLAERIQHHGWLEALIQSRTPEKNLVFRNQGLSGDTVTNRPRSNGFTPADGYLVQSKADIIFVFFGYNESFAGDKGLVSFTKSLDDMIESYRTLKPNGKSEPRFVLFSPIAHEDLSDRNLPDGKKNNERLAKYAAAIRKVAAKNETAFVDLFEPSKKLYADSKTPLTINGIHLTEEGNRRLAEVIAAQLLGEKVTAGEQLATLRDAVLDKNWHWFNRYRATDGNDIWGSRSSHKFVKNQTNREVLEHELKMLDVMTANRDKRIWAVARGQQYELNDANVPPPVPVESNVGGKSRTSSAQKEGSLKYLSGEEGVAKITVPEGFKVNLFADEGRFPELANPVQMQVDPKGRLWVASWPTYPKWEPLKKMNDCLLIFPDENRDGVADKAITFAHVHNPVGFEFWNGGVLVTRGPDLLFLKDTDGDDVADVRIVYAHGLGTSDTHHSANNLVYGPDGAIYWQSGIFLHNNIEHPWGRSLNTGATGMYRFDPRRYTISFHASNHPNPHGTSFDYWGYHYATDGTSGRAYQVRPDGKGFRMFPLLKKQVRPVPASAIVSSAHFPDETQGNFLICNAIGFRGLKQYKLDRDGGVTVQNAVGRGKDRKTVTSTTSFGEVWGTPVEDLLVSSDRNFRPTGAVIGEDGALYVSDWHNVIIGHMQHNVRDPNRDHQHGRIYRVTYPSRPLQEPVPIAGAPLPQLMANLEHPVDGVRHRTRVELSARNSDDVIAACREWMKKWDPQNKDHAHHLLEALWLHQQHNRIDEKLLNTVLKSPERHARVAAQTVQHHWYTIDHTHGGSPPPAEDPTLTETRPGGVISDSPELTEVRIGTIVEQLKFNLEEFQVKAGKKLHVTFENPDFIPHNVVFVQPGAADEVGVAAMALGEKGFAVGFVPDHDKIIIASELLDHDEEETLEFTAPAAPGDYQFVCTFPGHHIIMRGVMKVVK